MTYGEYLAGIDDSHQMTTAREHIEDVCRLCVGAERVLELGSHMGISTAAIAMALGGGEVVSVDLCDSVPQGVRESYWGSLGVGPRIRAVAGDAGAFIATSAAAGDRYDVIFHDARHGDSAVGEYMACATIADKVAIHDWEQLSPEYRRLVSSAFKYHAVPPADSRGRELFIGWSK